MPTSPSRLIERTTVAPGKEALTIEAGGRPVRWLVLLPTGATAGVHRPLAVALHNFDGNAEGFADLIHADRLRARGVIVALPQASGHAPDWKGPGLTLLAPESGEEGGKVDDIVGVADGAAMLARVYDADPVDVNLIGFSQGATLALAVTRRMDADHPAAVRRLFLAAGSIATPPDATLALRGTDLTAYEPGHNLPQTVADWRNGEPSEREYLPALLKIKQCAEIVHDKGSRLDRRDYACADGSRVVHIFEAEGEHAWPGQDAKYDSWLTGRGSTSALDFTNMIVGQIAPAP